MADASITARIGGDASGLVAALDQGRQAANKFATDFGNVMERKLGFKDVFKGVLQGIGIASVGAIADKLTAPFREAAESAEKIEMFTNRAADATERLIKLRQTEAQQLATSEKTLERIMKQLEAKKSEGPSRSFLGGIIDRGSALDKIFGFSRREDAGRKEAVDELGAKANEAGLEVAAQKLAMEKKAAAEAEKNYKTQIKNADDLAASRKALADFEHQSKLEALAVDEKLLALAQDKAKVDAEISQFQRIINVGGELTNDGAKELLDLKKQQKALESEIAAVTKDKAKAEALIGQTVASNIKQWEEFKGIINSVGRGDTELSDRELERKIQNIKAAQLASDLGRIDRVDVGNPGGLDPLAYANANNLAQAQAELAFRNKVRTYTANFGSDRAFAMLPGVTERRFEQINNTQTDMSKTNHLLEDIKRRLSAGIPTMAVNVIPGRL